MLKPKKILLAIVDNFIRNLYGEIFKKEGFEVLETKTVKTAIDLINKELPDVVVVDVLLYRVNGFEVLKEIKKQEETKEIPVIIFSQFEKEGEREKALELEAKDFIVSTKITPSEAVKRIKTVLGEQKTYRLPVDIQSEEVQKMASDLFDHKKI